LPAQATDFVLIQHKLRERRRRSGASSGVLSRSSRGRTFTSVMVIQHKLLALEDVVAPSGDVLPGRRLNLVLIQTQSRPRASTRQSCSGSDHEAFCASAARIAGSVARRSRRAPRAHALRPCRRVVAYEEAETTASTSSP